MHIVHCTFMYVKSALRETGMRIGSGSTARIPGLLS